MVNTIIYGTRRIVFIISRLFIICMSWSTQLFMSHVVLFIIRLFINCMSWSTHLFMSHAVLGL